MTTTPPNPESVLRAALHDSGDGCWYDADCGTGPEVCKGPDDSWHENQPARILAASPTLARAIALGLAWQRASAALPEGWRIVALESRVFDADGNPHGWDATAAHVKYDFWGGEDPADDVDATGFTPEAALIALAEALEARRG